jgi:hypothetical protein
MAKAELTSSQKNKACDALAVHVRKIINEKK